MYPAKPKDGIRATKPNESRHIDVTVIKLLDGTRTYLHAVIDNFSRRILAWRLGDRTRAQRWILPVKLASTLLDPEPRTLAGLNLVKGRSRRGTAKSLRSDARNPTGGSVGGGADHVAPYRPRKNLHLSFSFMRTDSTVGGLRMNHSCRLLFAAIVVFFVPSCSSSTSVAPTTTDAPGNGSITDDASTQGEVDAASDPDGGGGRGGTGGSNGSTTRCVPTSCAKLEASCGDYGDQCGGTLHCGICGQGLVCNPATKTCVLQTDLCSSSDSCGFLSDTCGNSYACGKTCSAGLKCQDNRCVACEPVSCDGRCGNIPDGCGGKAACGSCPSGQVCDALSFTCGVCKKVACTDYPAGTCGTLSDRCGGTLNCTCPTTTTKQPACIIAGVECGKFTDHCAVGVTHDCGNCEAGKVCNNNVCVSCTPLTCASAGKNCGTIDDGCGGKLACGDCQTNEICTTNVCKACTPKTCVSLGKNCGSVDDGCGNKLDCGTCQTNEICTSNVCTACTPKTCASAGKNCGSFDDGCGNKLDCGSCQTNEICTSNMCTACTPKSCASAGKNCGSLDDGCGKKLDCGSCQTNEICSSNLCTACVPKTCASLERACGKIDDGCGHTVNCPGCATGEVCLTNGTCCQPLTCWDVSGTTPDGCGGFLTCTD